MGTPVGESAPRITRAGAPVHGGADSPTPAGAGVELLERVVGDAPVLAGLADPRLELVVGGWLAGFRSARTRRAYGGDLLAFATWCEERSLDVLSARRVQVDLHTTRCSTPVLPHPR